MSSLARPRRILYLDSGAGIGGSSKSLYYQLAYLDRQRFEPIVAFYFWNDGPDTTRIRATGVPVFFLNRYPEPPDYVPFKFLVGGSRYKGLRWIKVLLLNLVHFVLVDALLTWKLLRLMRRQRIALLVLNNDVHYHLPGALAAWLGRIPCICRKSGGIGEAKRTRRALAPLVDAFVSISEATDSDQRLIVPSTKRLVKIYEGIDLKGFVPGTSGSTVRLQLGVPPGKKIVGSIARFEPGKGQIELIQAAALVLRRSPDVVFLIVGEEVPRKGPLLGRFQDLARSLGIAESIVFAGWREDISQLLAALDVFVHCPTTWIEGLGTASLEAMAMGKAIVVSDNGGLPDAVQDGVTGFVVPPGDIEKLAAALLRLLDDHELAARFGRNARKRVEELFDIEKNVKKLEVLFDEYALPCR